MMSMALDSVSTRDRIIEAASRLFHQQGIRAASVDLIAERAGLTKRSLYYHFRSKDDLIAACLEARDAPNLSILKQWYARSPGDVAQKVNGIFLGLARAARKDWQGCGFLRSAVELVEFPGHPARLREGRIRSGLKTGCVAFSQRGKTLSMRAGSQLRSCSCLTAPLPPYFFIANRLISRRPGLLP